MFFPALLILGDDLLGDVSRDFFIVRRLDFKCAAPARVPETCCSLDRKEVPRRLWGKATQGGASRAAYSRSSRRVIRLGGCLICLSVSHLMRRELWAGPISVASIRQCDRWDFRDAVSRSLDGVRLAAMRYLPRKSSVTVRSAHS